ncbi:unnamed protein product [Caenorhabditis auriculariae]|uniref:Uncharacterized protein n=1 Tax=Caenorhabditis auriculariae TaxID=2777116 RepID=A0A8S1HXD7_9PELO|nr:unnamed protein product [Caenorhabditis auriculariae]
MELFLEKNVPYTIITMVIVFFGWKSVNPATCPRFFSMRMFAYTILNFLCHLYLTSGLPHCFEAYKVLIENHPAKTYPLLFTIFLIFYIKTILEEVTRSRHGFFSRRILKISCVYWTFALICVGVTNLFVVKKLM